MNEVTIKDLGNRLLKDSKRGQLERRLMDAGVFTHKGLPTARQVARGNFAVQYSCGVCGRSGGAKARVIVTPAGEELVRRILGE